MTDQCWSVQQEDCSRIQGKKLTEILCLTFVNLSGKDQLSSHITQTHTRWSHWMQGGRFFGLSNQRVDSLTLEMTSDYANVLLVTRDQCSIWLTRNNLLSAQGKGNVVIALSDMYCAIFSHQNLCVLTGSVTSPAGPVKSVCRQFPLQ